MTASAQRPLIVVGDSLLDRDVQGRAERLAPDAPAPVVDVEEVRDRPGGAALAAVLVARARPGGVRLVTSLGGPSGDRVRDLLVANGVEVVDLGRSTPTPTKTRVRVGSACLVRLDAGDTAGPVLDQDAARSALAAALDGAVAVLASDYGGGVLAGKGVRAALSGLDPHAALVWDPHPRGGDPVDNAAVVTPNRAELAAAAGRRTDTLAEVLAVAADLLRRWSVGAVAVTRGPGGAVLVDRSGSAQVLPTEREASGSDPCGAGDCFAAATVTALAAGRLVSEAVTAAVSAATEFVAGGGAGGVQMPIPPPANTSSVTAGDSDGPRRASEPRPQVVATSGCFDLLHAGHVSMLEQARRLGDRLVVLLNSDDSVRRLKGPDRPLTSAADRATILRALSSVDEVVVFDEDTPLDALARLRPHLFVKGGDYAAADLPETQAMLSWGGATVTLPYMSGRSTTGLLTRWTGLPAPRLEEDSSL